MQESRAMNHLEDYLVCEINIEKSTEALELEKELGIKWDFEVYNHLETHYHLKACIKKQLIIEPKEVVAIPTGVYPQLLNPNFVIEVNSSSGFLYNFGIVMPEGVVYYPYTFRDEIHVILENKNDEPHIIYPAQNIAFFTVKLLPKMVVKYVPKIENSGMKFNTGKSFLKRIKNEKRNRVKIKETRNFEREDIDSIVGE